MASEDLKSKEARTLELIEFLARSNDKDDEDGSGEGMTDAQFMAFMEAILIIFEKCETKEECSEAMQRIMKRLQESEDE